MTRRMSGFNKPPSLVLGAAVGIAMTGVLSACANDRDVYCVDKDNRVVDEDKCDQPNSSGGPFFFMMGSFGSGHPVGTRLDGSRGSRISSTDRDARVANGLPRDGRVSNGSVSKKQPSSSDGKGGSGFGKGSSGKSGGWGKSGGG